MKFLFFSSVHNSWIRVLITKCYTIPECLGVDLQRIPIKIPKYNFDQKVNSKGRKSRLTLITPLPCTWPTTWAAFLFCLSLSQPEVTDDLFSRSWVRDNRFSRSLVVLRVVRRCLVLLCRGISIMTTS